MKDLWAGVIVRAERLLFDTENDEPAMESAIGLVFSILLIGMTTFLMWVTLKLMAPSGWPAWPIWAEDVSFSDKSSDVSAYVFTWVIALVALFNSAMGLLMGLAHSWIHKRNLLEYGRAVFRRMLSPALPPNIKRKWAREREFARYLAKSATVSSDPELTADILDGGDLTAGLLLCISNSGIGADKLLEIQPLEKLSRREEELLCELVQKRRVESFSENVVKKLLKTDNRTVRLEVFKSLGEKRSRNRGESTSASGLAFVLSPEVGDAAVGAK